MATSGRSSRVAATAAETLSASSTTSNRSGAPRASLSPVRVGASPSATRMRGGLDVTRQAYRRTARGRMFPEAGREPPAWTPGRPFKRLTGKWTNGLLRRNPPGRRVAEGRRSVQAPPDATELPRWEAAGLRSRRSHTRHDETRRHLKVKVLIADDNRLMLEGFRRALEPVEDIEIVGATHAGAHVLSLIERRRPEVVVIELGMRTADGDPCLDAIHQAHPDLKIVVLSASPSELVIRSALSRGARAFITKAVNPLDIPSA